MRSYQEVKVYLKNLKAMTFKKTLQTIEDYFNTYLKDGWETVFHNQN